MNEPHENPYTSEFDWGPAPEIELYEQHENPHTSEFNWRMGPPPENEKEHEEYPHTSEFDWRMGPPPEIETIEQLEDYLHTSEFDWRMGPPPENEKQHEEYPYTFDWRMGPPPENEEGEVENSPETNASSSTSNSSVESLRELSTLHIQDTIPFVIFCKLKEEQSGNTSSKGPEALSFSPPGYINPSPPPRPTTQNNIEEAPLTLEQLIELCKNLTPQEKQRIQGFIEKCLSGHSEDEISLTTTTTPSTITSPPGGTDNSADCGATTGTF